MEKPRASTFANYLWLVVAMILIIAVVFSFYVWTEKRLDKANDLRLKSFLLTSELLLSTNNLTRMVRTYVATGDPKYKKYYEDILDIRNGKMLRPKNYLPEYWDLVVTGRKSQFSDTGQGIALLDLIEESGFPQQELYKLTLAKIKSEELAKIEFEAMKLIETTTSKDSADKNEAISLLFDDNYHLAKFQIIQLINEAVSLMDKRTRQSVKDAKYFSRNVRLLFIAVTLSLIFILVRLYTILKGQLGGTLDVVQSEIAKIGSGIFTENDNISKRKESSVLGWLAKMQSNLINRERELKRGKEELLQSELKFHTLFDSTADAILMLDDKSFFDCNPAALELFGLQSKKELCKYHPADLSPELQQCGTDSMSLAKHYMDMAKQKNSVRFEWIHKRADSGKMFITDILLTTLMLDGKSVLQTTIRDISDKKAADQRFQDIVNNTDGIVWEADANPFKFTFLSKYAEVLTGYSIEDCMQPGFWIEHRHPDDKDWSVDYCISCAAKLESHNLDYRFITKDGRTIWLHETVKVVAEAGKPRWLNGIMVDITERKLAETELKIAATAFESQEGMMVTDANNVILRVNKAFTFITGYSSEEVIGKTPSLLKSGRQSKEFYTKMWDSITNTGSWEGEIWNRRKNSEIYPENLTISAVKDATGSVTNYVANRTDITMRKRASAKIENLAFYDPLTKLPNRSLMLERLSHALSINTRSEHHGALLFLDIDHFKTLNDTLGHNVGDVLLQQVAERLTNCLRGSDTAARMGGDEFVVLLEDLSELDIDSATQAEATGYKILAALNAPYKLGSHVFNSSASIGIALFDKQPVDVEELLGQADIAMYQAKSSGRNTLRFFDPEMQDTINKNAELEKDLRIAIEQQQFELYYQIQVDQAGLVFGAEALIRWHHPDRGMVSPLEFIPAAEESELILRIGQWVLETACAQLQKWQQQPLNQDLTISINVSSKQFAQADFVDQVKATVKYYAINPMQLNLELTESLLLNDLEETIATMNALQAIGIRFELDDFGTGYSSLQYLKKLPLYQLKIDKGFVRELTSNGSDQVIVSTIIAMAKSLGLKVIAEGVETKMQRERLFDKGCSNYQGYLFSKPVPIEQLEALLKNSSLEI